ncbi:class III extradiol ring-cleavage dioxygenase [Marinobacter sp. CHS3-4]|uniref:DODA-type extradiol aromatic ring-opening family dioxygenase n=1 Tax=Marinobacter sp. CHS3-4 TaxID=3045174 RepID=UPI0024B536A6|nr:class III extradiol ring-cleavage dioxygenase [Marinobacter sp. CHS3-4]MDI9246422.1 class III extradiol ring-cleavage dioxygenase [Marinobacter sp. CHS3-4]
MAHNTNVVFLSHGGGPMPLLGDPGHQAMVDALSAMAERLAKPSAILVISAHWEAERPTITAGATPPLIYDYYGFPEEAYRIEYPCPGHPALAQQIQKALGQAGIASALDEDRGFDHGLFVPLALMYPEADIPCVQLSLVNTLDAETHIALGRALQSLDVDNLLVIGSGFSFHNMKAFFSADSDAVETQNQLFEAWLQQTCTEPSMTEDERARRLMDWEKAPAARFCHPREEHLLPLHVCYGLAGRAADWSQSVRILGRVSSLFFWDVYPSLGNRAARK